jgi:hypothetical protein
MKSNSLLKCGNEKLQNRGLKCIKKEEEILGINRTIAKQSLVLIRKGYKYM